MHAVGLLDGFQTSFTADPFHCLKKIKKEMINNKINRNDKKSLTLKNLSGAFVVLAIGYSLAILVFLFEVCFIRYKNDKIRQQQLIEHRAEEAQRQALAARAAAVLATVETSPADPSNVVSSNNFK